MFVRHYGIYELVLNYIKCSYKASKEKNSTRRCFPSQSQHKLMGIIYIYVCVCVNKPILWLSKSWLKLFRRKYTRKPWSQQRNGDCKAATCRRVRERCERARVREWEWELSQTRRQRARDLRPILEMKLFLRATLGTNLHFGLKLLPGPPLRSQFATAFLVGLKIWFPFECNHFDRKKRSLLDSANFFIL